MRALQEIHGSNDWRSLVDAVDRGACILMLGPDAVTVDGTGEPLTTRLAAEMVAGGAPADAEAGLWAVAQSVLGGGDRNALYALARPYLVNARLDRETLAPLARLPFGLVVNTVPGARVEEIWRETDGPDRQTRAAYYSRAGTQDRPPAAGTTASPLVYHLFGALDDLDSLVLAESDLLDFLVGVIGGDPPLPGFLTAEMRARSKSLLFLGFRLGEWPLRVLMRALASESRRSLRSYALESRAPAPSTAQFYQEGHNVHFYRLDVPEFARRLEADVQALHLPRTATAPPPAAADSRDPLVFISYASEDRDAAGRISAALQRAGVRTWFDVDDLRGGDAWEQRITAELRHGSTIDYMVILQTPTLAGKVDAFVNVEIKLGLRRQNYFRDSADLAFIIPVTIGGGDDTLPELDGLQSVDLASPDDVDPLLAAIRGAERRKAGPG